MRKDFTLTVCVLLLSTLIGCETVRGAAKDMGNTARNIRDILGVGRDIGNMTK